jgi:hypothetical protein
LYNLNYKDIMEWLPPIAVAILTWMVYQFSEFLKTDTYKDITHALNYSLFRSQHSDYDE